MYIPGDEVFKEPVWTVDQSVSLRATPAEVWPWLAQMGDGRAGWYSYDWIDNWGKKSFETIDRQLQDLSVGQKISIFKLTDFKEPEYLTLTFSENANMTWFLKNLEEGCELITRLRVRGPKWLLSCTLGPGHFIMQRKQFIEIKKRVEKNPS